jgi:hypothetical protein
MNRDDIIRMAREAGCKDLREFDSEMRDDIFISNTQDLERFAALVSAAERERIASQWDALHDQYIKDPLRRQMMLSYEMVARMIRGRA